MISLMWLKTLKTEVQSLAVSTISLTKHHFIAKSQADYLRTLKEKLEPGEVIVLGDYSENL